MNMQKKILCPDLRFFFLASVFIIFVFQAIYLPSAFSKGENRITRIEFIHVMSKYQPENPLFPKNSATLSEDELYLQTVQSLKLHGFNVLEGKDPEGSLQDMEFVIVTYAFTGAPAGKSLLDQKLYLKNAGIVISPDIGLATAVEGKVFQSTDGEDLKRRTQLASPVFLKDKIATETNSKVSFAFDDASTISIGENARVTITKHIFDPDKNLRQTVVEVSLGAVRFVVTKGKNKDSTFKVVSPAAIAGVRGTEFVVIVKPDGTTTFVGLEGSIETIPFSPEGKPGKAQIISGNHSQQISESGQAGEVTRVPSELLQKAKQETAIEATIPENRGITGMKAEMAARAAKKERLANEARKETETSRNGDEIKSNLEDADNFPHEPLKEQGLPGKPIRQHKPVS